MCHRKAYKVYQTFCNTLQFNINQLHTHQGQHTTNFEHSCSNYANTTLYTVIMTTLSKHLSECNYHCPRLHPRHLGKLYALRATESPYSLPPQCVQIVDIDSLQPQDMLFLLKWCEKKDIPKHSNKRHSKTFLTLYAIHLPF